MIYIIFSSFTLSKIYRTLIEYGKEYLNNQKTQNLEQYTSSNIPLTPQNLIGLLAIDRFKDKETSRTAVLISVEFYQYISSNYKMIDTLQNNNFTIEKYVLANHNRPPRIMQPNEKIALKIEPPSNYTIDMCKHYLNMYVQKFITFGMVKEGQILIKIPYKSREGHGTHNGVIYINFKENITYKQISNIRLFLNNSQWDLETYITNMNSILSSNINPSNSNHIKDKIVCQWISINRNDNLSYNEESDEDLLLYENDNELNSKHNDSSSSYNTNWRSKDNSSWSNNVPWKIPKDRIKEVILKSDDRIIHKSDDKQFDTWFDKIQIDDNSNNKTLNTLPNNTVLDKYSDIVTAPRKYPNPSLLIIEKHMERSGIDKETIYVILEAIKNGEINIKDVIQAFPILINTSNTNTTQSKSNTITKSFSKDIGWSTILKNKKQRLNRFSETNIGDSDNAGNFPPGLVPDIKHIRSSISVSPPRDKEVILKSPNRKLSE